MRHPRVLQRAQSTLCTVSPRTARNCQPVCVQQASIYLEPRFRGTFSCVDVTATVIVLYAIRDAFKFI